MLPPEIRFIQRGWLNSNSILILGEGGPVIVDTGYGSCVDETLALIRQAGVHPETLQLIVTTHGHSDHHGGNGRLKRLSGAKIGMGEKTAVWFARNDRRSLWLDYLGQEAELVPADVTYGHGEHIMLAGMPFEVIATPGHAPDAISLYQPDTKLLICADAMWENDLGILNTAVHGPQVLDAAELALRRMQQLDVKTAVPGHGRLISNATKNLEKVARRLARFRREPGQIAWHLVRRVMMFNLLRFQPISRAQLITDSLAWPWLFDYAPACGYDHPEPLLHNVLNDFLSRGIVRMQAELLTSHLPR